MTFGSLGGVTGSNFSIQDVNSTCNPVIRCLRVLRMGFVQNRRFWIFFHWLIMERSQNWPDFRSQISKFWDIHFIDTVVCSNRWKFQGNCSVGVALTNIQTFYEVRSLDVTWWPDLAWFWSDIFTTCAEKRYDKAWQKRRRSAPTFFWQSGKKRMGVLNTPSPRRAKVNLGFDRMTVCY